MQQLCAIILYVVLCILYLVNIWGMKMKNIKNIKSGENAEITAFARKHRLTVREFGRSEAMIGESDSHDILWLMLSGSAYLAGIKENGKRGIVDFFMAGDITGRYMFPVTAKNSYFYIASSGHCKTACIGFDKLLKLRESGDKTAEKLVRTALLQASERACTHTYILQQRTTEDKLTAFFEYMSVRSGSDSFTLPMSYTNLADYLAVDRSAMMRELKRLKDGGVISADKLKISIL